MKIKDIFPENERVDRTAYVVQHEDNEFTNTIIECKVNAELSVYDTGEKHLCGILYSPVNFKNDNDKQVFRISNDTRNTNGIKPKDFDVMLNSDSFNFYDFHIYVTKEGAEQYVKCMIEKKTLELEQQLKNIKHINYVYY